MKVLSIIVIIILGASTAWLGIKNAEANRKLETVRDTLYSLKIQQQALFDQYNRDVFEKIGEPYLELSNEIAETHRINTVYGKYIVLLRVEIKSDSSINAVYKRFTLKNPLTGDGEDSLYVIANPRIDVAVFKQFKAKLAQVEFPAAVLNNEIMCCFGGGTLSWEAVIRPSNRYRFSTFCRQSEQFAEACEFLLRQVDDADLKQILH